MEYIKNNFFSILTAIPLVLIAIGSMVITQYLAKYGVIDFPIFDGRTLYIGFIALLQLSVFCILWYSFFSLKGEMNELPFLVFNPIWKTIVYSTTMFSITGQNTSLIDFDLFGFTWNSSILFKLSYTSFLGFFILVVGKEYIDNGIKKDKLGLLYFCLGAGFTILSIIPTFILLKGNPVFRGFFFTYFYISIILVIQTMQVWARKNDDLRGIKTQSTSLFTKEKKITKMDYAYMLFWAILVLMLNLSYYSKNIFPYLSTNYGGGNYKFKTLIMNDNKKFTGTIIHANEEYIYLYDDSVLKQVPISNINEYR